MDDADARRLEALLAEARGDPDVNAVLLFGSEARGDPARDVDVALDIARETARAWEDFRPHYERYLAEVQRGWA